ncbi:TPR-12 multi-domain protein [Pyrenophora tritici-repentis]|nr:TPR-12 multi-domain protein [Pyrenophora tritici-repentis]
MAGTKPTSCADYHVAWICPVADIELLPARLMLDEEYPTPLYDTHYDENTYVCGTISGHAVVVATCPPGETGNVNAGRLTGSMFKTFPNIRMAVLVGIGGGIPGLAVSEDSLENVHLGDVVVGWPGDGKPACVYHERGRWKVDGQFEMVGTMGNPDWRLTNALGFLAVDYEMGKTTFEDQLARLQRSKSKKKFTRPRLKHDKLFKTTYRHAGDYRSNCTTCDPSELVQRPQRSEEEQHTLVFHRGRIATGNAVIHDGELRDQIRARCDGALCVEMEAAGVDANRRCLVIRGISNYADSHKSDMWRSYAAGNAAATVLWLVPLPRPQSFVGRTTQLAQLSTHISLQGCHRLAIYGLGGCGKTALALEAAYRAGEQQPAHAIFWVPAVSRESFEQAYREIGRLLRIPGITGAKADVKQLVKARLSDEGFGQWLMVVDNADDVDVLFEVVGEGRSGDRLIDYLPHSRKGSIVFTTRARKAAIDLAENNVIVLGELSEREALEMVRTRLILEQQYQVEDEVTVREFLGMLAFLALAIVQAVAFINRNDSTLSGYIRLYRASEEEAGKLLSKEFKDQSRYEEIENAIATTWYISFEQIQKHDKVAAGYLSFMACTTNNNIPLSMLPIEGSEVEQIEAIGTLKAYTFITERQPQADRHKAQEQQEHSLKSTAAFNVHPLVHLAMQGWLKAHDQWFGWAERTMMRLVEVLSLGEIRLRKSWMPYLPHATCVADIHEILESEGRLTLLKQVGRWEHVLGRDRAAEKAHRHVLKRQESTLGKEHVEMLASMSMLAHTLCGQGKYAEAEVIDRETLALREKVSGKEHPDTITSMNHLAQALGGQGKYAEAEAMHREMLALREKVLGHEHPDTLASMSNLALVLDKQGKYEEAEAMNRQTLARRENVLGPEHPDTLTSVYYLAHLLAKQHRVDESLLLYQRASAGYDTALRKGHPTVLVCDQHYADL